MESMLSPHIVKQGLADGVKYDKVNLNSVISLESCRLLLQAGYRCGLYTAINTHIKFECVSGLKICLPYVDRKLLNQSLFCNEGQHLLKFRFHNTINIIKLIMPYIKRRYYHRLLTIVVRYVNSRILEYILTYMGEHTPNLTHAICISVCDEEYIDNFYTLLTHGKNISSKTILKAAKYDNIYAANMLIQHGIPINEELFHGALEVCNVRIIKLLLPKINIDTQDEVLMVYILSLVEDNEQCFNFMFNYFSPDSSITINRLFKLFGNNNIYTFIEAGVDLSLHPEMFIYHIEDNEYDIVEKFVLSGVDIHYKNDLPLITAVQADESNEIIRLLLDHGANLTADNHQAYRSATNSDYRYILFNYYHKQGLHPPKIFEMMTSNDCNAGYDLLTLQPYDGYIIGYGNPEVGYTAFSITDLINVYKNGRRNPYADEYFNMEDLQHIYTIISEDNNFDLDEIQMFSQYMIDYQIQQTELSDSIYKLKQMVYKSNLRRLFVYLFAMGMYFRQWKGPGDEYPLLKEQTEQTSGVYLDQAITMVHSKYIQALSGLDDQNIYQELPVVNIISGKLEFESDNIKNMYKHTIIQPESCIRMFSTTFIITGAYYLKVILGEDIPGYNLGNLIDGIS